MNIANQMTILRMLLAFVCVWLIHIGTFSALAWGLIVFGVASFTDFLDGFFARRLGVVSDLGRILDPVADKVLVLGVFIAFVEAGVVSTWMVILIIFRELLITSLRLLVLNKGIVLEAKMLGKHKMVSQIAGIVAIFLVLIIFEKAPQHELVRFALARGIPFIMGYIVIITLFSGGHYLWQNRKLINTV